MCLVLRYLCGVFFANNFIHTHGLNFHNFVNKLFGMGLDMYKELLAGLLAYFFMVCPAHALPIVWTEWQETTQASYKNDFYGGELPIFTGTYQQELENHFIVQFSFMEMSEMVDSFSSTLAAETTEGFSNEAPVGDVKPISEPTTMLLLGLGLVGISSTRSRFRMKKLSIPWFHIIRKDGGENSFYPSLPNQIFN